MFGTIISAVDTHKWCVRLDYDGSEVVLTSHQLRDEGDREGAGGVDEGNIDDDPEYDDVPIEPVESDVAQVCVWCLYVVCGEWCVVCGLCGV